MSSPPSPRRLNARSRGSGGPGKVAARSEGAPGRTLCRMTRLLPLLALSACGPDTHYPRASDHLLEQAGGGAEEAVIPCSSGGAPTWLTLDNEVAIPLVLGLMDPATCAEVEQGTIPAFGIWELESHAGAVWTVRNEDRHLLDWFEVPAGDAWTEALP